MWVSPIIICYVCVNIKNYEYTHPMRDLKADHFHIPMKVNSNLSLLHTGIPPCDPSPTTPTHSGRRFHCCFDPMYFGFIGHCILGVHHPAHLRPTLVQKIMMENYTPPPPLFQHHACSAVNGLLQSSHVRDYYGGVDKGAIERNPWTPPWIYQYHPGSWTGRWSPYRPSRPVIDSVWPSCLKFPLVPSTSPHKYPPSSTALPHLLPSPEWCVIWDTVPLRWAESQWIPHINAPMSQSWRVHYGWDMEPQGPSVSPPRWYACG